MNAFATMAQQLAHRAPATGIRPSAIKVGNEYGDWTVIAYTPASGYWPDRTDARAKCRCSCGEVRDVLASSLRRGKSKSCGHDTYGRPPRSGV